MSRGVGGWLWGYRQHLLCECLAELTSADEKHWLGDQRRGEDLCIQGESGTDAAQEGRLPQIDVFFLNRGACGLACD